MIAPQCDPRDPRIHCIGRSDAAKRGDFFYDFPNWRWVWVPMRDHEGVRGAWETCPWCHGLLPSPDAMADHVLMVIGTDEED